MISGVWRGPSPSTDPSQGQSSPAIGGDPPLASLRVLPGWIGPDTPLTSFRMLPGWIGLASIVVRRRRWRRSSA